MRLLQLGTVFSVFIETSYSDGLSIVDSNSNDNIIFEPITTVLSMSNLNINYGDSAFDLTPLVTTISSGVLNFTTDDSSVATISNGSILNIVGVGNCKINVFQAEIGVYTSAEIDIDLVVNPAAPTFSSFTISSKNYGAANFTPTYPTSNSPGAFTYSSSNTSVATVNSTTGVITVGNLGTTTITVTQAATTNYTSGSVQATLTVINNNNNNNNNDND